MVSVSFLGFLWCTSKSKVLCAVSEPRTFSYIPNTSGNSLNSVNLIQLNRKLPNGKKRIECQGRPSFLRKRPFGSSGRSFSTKDCVMGSAKTLEEGCKCPKESETIWEPRTGQATRNYPSQDLQFFVSLQDTWRERGGLRWQGEQTRSLQSSIFPVKYKTRRIISA